MMIVIWENSPTAKTRAELKKEKNQNKGVNKTKSAYAVFAEEKRDSLKKDNSSRLIEWMDITY